MTEDTRGRYDAFSLSSLDPSLESSAFLASLAMAKDAPLPYVNLYALW